MQLASLAKQAFECVSICSSMHMKNCLDFRFKYIFTFTYILHVNVICVYTHTQLIPKGFPMVHFSIDF